ncbi:phosphatase PAP2 family protein [Wenyingzhuangia aestuarii]|uniref:phosphatase PAP2 family protein n=1 Tax=Wenyingzhuangia aestuarii TaxID=1647582 RepID=UPI00143B6C19|nr:phosphatase PAP2 family protein [Wenyingzhuangia aestuarii]NJB83244.1 membrane-associated phospholipid phosphatase [Wenyingzhuangia aestuarii]
MVKKICFFLGMLSFCVQAQEVKSSYFPRTLTTATNVIKTSFKTIPSDFVYMGKNVSEDWKKTALYTGIVASLVLVDKPVTKFYQQEIESRIKYTIPDITIGDTTFPWVSGNDAYMFYSMSGIYLGSLFGGYEKGQYAAINGFKALTYSILISHVMLKTVFGRARPHVNLASGYTDNDTTTGNPFNFFNSRDGEYVFSKQNGTAMPSLHATAFFAMAKVFQMEFDNYWIPYSFAGIVFLAEIKEHRHWVSDMVAGGIIGTVIGRSIVKSSWKARGILPNKEKSIAFQWIPSISSRFNGLTMLATF